MNITINFDASYRDDVRKGAYAYWISYQNYYHREFGVFKNQMDNSLEAEFNSLLYAMGRLCDSTLKVTRLHIYTDCEAVITYVFNKKPKAKHKYIINFLDSFMDYISRMKPEDVDLNTFLKIDYTKGHMLTHERHNRDRNLKHFWCDTSSRTVLRKIIKEQSQ